VYIIASDKILVGAQESDCQAKVSSASLRFRLLIELQRVPAIFQL
jgi:hypothetical protein